MRILTALTYYRPHTSGLTIYAERLVKALAARGHAVTVLTTQYEKHLPLEETQDGVRIVRVPVVARINKGVIAPGIGRTANRLIQEHDVLLLHLPQFDAAGMALRGRLYKRPTVILYHCDILLPPGLFNRLVNTVVNVMNNLAGSLADRIVAYTEDFATHSPYLTRFAAKREIITPNVYLPPATPEAISALRQKYNPNGQKVIGMATRFAAEKGVEVLLDALPAIFERHPDAKVLYAGQYEGVWGEAAYAEKLMPRIREYEAQGRWQFLGVLKMDEMAAYFPNLDVLVVPSLNSTETFGFVQIEAMMNGVPCVAANLPGVRQPVKMTGMGQVTPIGDAPALAAAVLEILAHPESYRGDPAKIRQQFHPDTNAAAFEGLFERMLAEKQAPVQLRESVETPGKQVKP
jgi:glycosyltransferase involved in cell wall biosynthesis